jgi:hypothetical protein
VNWPDRSSRARLLALLLGALLGAAGAPPGASAFDFDELPSLSDVTAAPGYGASISSALVVSEADAALLTGFDTAGRWATSGTQGLLNTLAPSIRFSFDLSHASSFSADVLSIEKDGMTAAIEMLGHSAHLGLPDVLVVSDPSLIGDSGLHEQRLEVIGDFDWVEVGSQAGDTSRFFLDSTASTFVIPEPGTLPLLGTGLLALAARIRARGNRS